MLTIAQRTLRGLLLAAAGVIAAAASTAAAGCGGGASGSVSYSASAERNYEKGETSLKDEDWIAASKYFGFIKSRFPYSRYAVLAELRNADAEFGAEEYLAAIADYRVFIQLHPSNEQVVNGYASFRIGAAYARQLPGDSWIFPPAHEKDQTATDEAETELRAFIEKYPDSPYHAQAETLFAGLGKRLAAHEWYVARYYWDRDQPMGTALRLRRLLDRYRGVGYDVDALWLLGRAYVAVGMPERARQAWAELVEKFPTSGHAGDARRKLAQMPVASPVATPAVAPAFAPMAAPPIAPTSPTN